ncbi:MAG: hypothetical protein AABX39_04410, partial [Nanoarchaeota archaeon]
ENVKARNEDGMYILSKVGEKATNFPKSYISIGGIQRNLVEIITEKNADTAAIQCICGKHKITRRGMLQGFVDFNPDVGNFADILYGIALRSFYIEPIINKTKLQIPPQPQKGLFERIKNYLFK